MTDGPTLEQRREAIALLAADRDAIRSISEQHGEDVLPMFLQAIAVELLATSLAVEEADERLETVEVGMKVTGALEAGLVGLEEQPETGDDTIDGLRAAMHKHGAAIRRGSGLPLLQS